MDAATNANPTDSFTRGDRVVLTRDGINTRNGAVYTVTAVNSATSLQVSRDGGKGRGWALRGDKSVRVISRREVGALDASGFNAAEKDLIESIRCGRDHVLEAPIRATVAHKIFRAYQIDMPASHLDECAQTFDQIRAKNVRDAIGSGPDYEKMILDRDAADSSWWT